MNPTLPSFFNDARLTLVDVGARGGLSCQWDPFKHLITTVLVEPDPVETDDHTSTCFVRSAAVRGS